MENNYLEKYLKYKKKYLNLKKIDKVHGGSAAAIKSSNDQRPIIARNYTGTCWYQVVLSLFFNSPVTREGFEKSVSEFTENVSEVEKKLNLGTFYSIIRKRLNEKLENYENYEKEKRFKHLSVYQIPQISQILIEVIKRFIKLKIILSPFSASDDDVDYLNELICETKITEEFRKLIPIDKKIDKKWKSSGTNRETYIFSNILSIGILEKFTNSTSVPVVFIGSKGYSNFLEFFSDPNVLGYVMDIDEHVFCIFKDRDGVYKYINNSTVLDLSCKILLRVGSNYKYRKSFNNFKELLETLVYINEEAWEEGLTGNLYLIDDSIVLDIKKTDDMAGGAGAWAMGMPKSLQFASKEEKEEKSRIYNIPKYDDYMDVSYEEIIYKLNILNPPEIHRIIVHELSDTTTDYINNFI